MSKLIEEFFRKYGDDPDFVQSVAALLESARAEMLVKSEAAYKLKIEDLHYDYREQLAARAQQLAAEKQRAEEAERDNAQLRLRTAIAGVASPRLSALLAIATWARNNIGDRGTCTDDHGGNKTVSCWPWRELRDLLSKLDASADQESNDQAAGERARREHARRRDLDSRLGDALRASGINAADALAVQALYAVAGQSGSHRIVAALRAVEGWLREESEVK